MEKEVRPLTFTVDPSDYDGLRQIMDEYGDSEVSFSGDNENLEEVMISVAKDRIDVVTFQSNGWTRRNLYEPHNEPAETLGALSAYKPYRIR